MMSNAAIADSVYLLSYDFGFNDTYFIMSQIIRHPNDSYFYQSYMFSLLLSI